VLHDDELDVAGLLLESEKPSLLVLVDESDEADEADDSDDRLEMLDSPKLDELELNSTLDELELKIRLDELLLNSRLDDELELLRPRELLDELLSPRLDELDELEMPTLDELLLNSTDDELLEAVAGRMTASRPSSRSAPVVVLRNSSISLPSSFSS